MSAGLLLQFASRRHLQSARLHTDLRRVERGGIELRIGPRDHNIGFRNVIFDQPIQRRDLFRVLRCQIVILSNVFSQIVQPVRMLAVFAIVEGANQFPVAVMHRHRRRQPVRGRSVPGHEREHRPTVHSFTMKCLGKIHTVDDVPRGPVHIQHLQRRRIQIGGLDPHLATRTRLGDSRPNDHRWDTQPAFVDSAFAPTQRMVTGNRCDVPLAGGRGFFQSAMHIATIIRIENDHRVVGDPFGFECIEQTSDGVIQRMHHSGVGGRLLQQTGFRGLRREQLFAHLIARTLIHRLAQLLPVVLDQLGFRTERSVNGKLPVVQKKRFTAIALL